MSFAPSFASSPFVFFTGTKSSATAVPFSVLLDGRTFAVDLKDYRRSSLASLRESVISTGQVDDALFNTDGAWWRYKHDWSYGAGQSVLDLGQDRDSRRFKKSVGIDPWTESQLTLHHSTSSISTTVKTTAVYLVATSDHLYAADASVLYRTSNLSTWTQITGISGTINGLTTDGKSVYVSTTSAIYEATSASAAATSRKAHTHNGCWFVGNYLLTAEANKLRTLATGTGTETTIVEHYNTNFIWNSVFAVGSKIYAGGTAGNRSEVYSFSVDTTGTLVRGAEVVSFSVGEKLNTAISHVGNVIFCTNKGIRMATVSQDGTLTYGPLIDEPGSVVSAYAEGRYVWFSWTEVDTGKTGAGRLDLSTTPRPLQPAYASDLYVETSNTCTAVCRFSDRLILGIPSLGIYAENSDAYVVTGYVESGNVFFGTVERKIVNDLRANFVDLDSNESVRLDLFDNNGTLLESSGIAEPNLGQLELQLDGQEADYFNITVELNGPGTSTPTFKRWRLRAFPIVPPVEQFVVPLLLYSKVVINDAQGQIHSSDVSSELQFIEEIWERKSPISYVEGSKVYRVRIEAFEFQAREWADTYIGLEGTLIVRLVTI